MTTVQAFSAASSTDPFLLTTIPRRDVGPNDVSIQIKYCGICHTDISLYRNSWGISSYPIVPGHEMVGIVDAVGENVTRFKVGDKAGIGCIVDSCRKCDQCDKGLENYCRAGMTLSYGSPDPKLPGLQTYGGYSEKYVADEKYVLRIPDNLDFAAAAPLLCAGITMFSPLIDGNVTEGTKVGIIGIGGLGHVGIKIARALGAEVYGFTSRESKVETIKALGATDVIVTSSPENFNAFNGKLDLVIDTISDAHDISQFLTTLRPEGTYTMVGAGTVTPPTLLMLMKGLYFHGSGTGGIARTQEMLDLCAKHNITADIEIGHLKDLPTLYDRIEKGDVRYRIVLDIENDFKSVNINSS